MAADVIATGWIAETSNGEEPVILLYPSAAEPDVPEKMGIIGNALIQSGVAVLNGDHLTLAMSGAAESVAGVPLSTEMATTARNLGWIGVVVGRGPLGPGERMAAIERYSDEVGVVALGRVGIITPGENH